MGDASTREWFRHRPDGTDPVRREPAEEVPGHLPARLRERATGARCGTSCSSVVLLLDRRRACAIFRVDNPHTKPFAVLGVADRARCRREHPGRDLPGRGLHPAEGDAPARPRSASRSRTPTSPGATRSAELDRVLHRADAAPTVREYFRPNFWPNTPDILPEYLQHGGRPAFAVAARPGGHARRRATASTGRPSSCARTSRGEPGSEEYLRLREVRGPALGPRPRRTRLRPLDHAASTAIRREQPGAAARPRALRFHGVDNDALICLREDAPPTWPTSMLVVVNLDPHHAQRGWVDARPRRARASTPTQPFQVHDLLGGRALHLARAAQLRRARPRGRARPTSSACAGACAASTTSSTSCDRCRPTLTEPHAIAGADDPLWYKDAVIYELHVRAFGDSDGDGIGDFRGLTQQARLPAGPGRHRALAAAVLPVAAARRRLRHRRLHERPSRPTARCDDFRGFLREAHAAACGSSPSWCSTTPRDQHPWFQRARRAPPGSRWRDFYVWSDTPERYQDARIIFKDFEPRTGPGTRSPRPTTGTASTRHQPDLNYDNPAVRRGDASRSLDFWLEHGRRRAAARRRARTCYEREGTNCENLPETHDFLKRAARARRRAITGTACCWPRPTSGPRTRSPTSATATSATWRSTSRSCRGCSWRCSMEDRFPIIDILEQTPPIPDDCQWALFLRNHDELTLEMVTDEERDYMYRAYAARPAGAHQPRHPPPPRAAAAATTAAGSS